MFNEDAKTKLLKTMLKRPRKEFSVRELAREADISPASASMILREFRKKGMFSMRTIGKNHLYLTDLQNPLVRQWKILSNIQEIMDSKLIGIIKENYSDLMGIILFGSMAKGTNDHKSDYDILVITANKQKKEADISKIKSDYQINIHKFSFEQWKTAFKTNKAFYSDIIEDGIVLYGEKVKF